VCTQTSSWAFALARRQRESVGCATGKRLAPQHLAQTRFVCRSDDPRNGLTQQLLRRLTQMLAGVLAHLQNLQVTESHHQQRTVRLDATRRLHRLAVAGREGGAMALDTVGAIAPG
jgi:triphosphoribosyl-dephospho-CoA synthetase